MLTICVTETDLTVESVVKRNFPLSNKLKRTIRDAGGVMRNGIVCRWIDRVLPGDVITIDLTAGFGQSDIKPAKSACRVLYEDDWMLVVYKPANLLVHPLQGIEQTSLVNQVRTHQLHRNESYVIRPVTRLDRHTTGIVTIAKNSFVHYALQKQMQKGTFLKTYMAVVCGVPMKSCDTLQMRIARESESIIKRMVSNTGKSAVTHYRTIISFKRHALLKIRIKTGRTHQIRVHLSAIGHPILGDWLYGEECTHEKEQWHGPYLHAYAISFDHPITNKRVVVYSRWPACFTHLLYQLRKKEKCDTILE